MFNRFVIAGPIAIAVSAIVLGAAAAPASAAPQTCAVAPAKIRAAAATSTDADAARKALVMVATAEKMCAEGGSYDASKKFAAAAKVLGTDLAALPAPSAQ